MLYIEEPELYLHPGFQRILIDEILATPQAIRQVFVTTHSHQFLDITIDSSACSVYRFIKSVDDSHPDENDASVSIVRAAGPDFDVLSDLGVRNSSVLLSNCTIWVEGITDRLYYRHFLDLYQSQHSKSGGPIFKEDLQYSFVEYSGGNITHWSFLDDEESRGIDVDRLCGRLMLIADSDERLDAKVSEKKTERHRKLAAKLGKRFVKLDVTEVENLLTPETIRDAVCEIEGAPITQRLSLVQDDYRQVGLGKYIQRKLMEAGHQTTGRAESRFEGKSGTIKNKVPFCQVAIAAMKSFGDLSEEAKEIARKIYNFILEQNR